MIQRNTSTTVDSLTRRHVSGEEFTNNIYLSVVIPSYNEEARIGETLNSINSYLNEQDYKYEIIVVDDCSTDNTVEIAKEFSNKIDGLILSHAEEKRVNLGKGDAVSRGMRLAHGRYRVFIDADGATPFWQIEKSLETIEKDGCDIAIGSRYAEGAKIVQPRGAIRTFVSRGGNVVIKALLGLPYKDTRCGFKLFTADAADIIFSKVLLTSFGFDDEILVLAEQFGFKVREVPIEWHEKDGSTVSTIDVIRSFSEIRQIRQNFKKGRYGHTIKDDTSQAFNTLRKE